MLRIRGLPPETITRMITSRGTADIKAPQHVFICVADHFEPMWKCAPRHVQEDRLERWEKGYPNLAEGIRDVRGRPPQHTFFYPAEAYQAFHLDRIAGICRQGLGDVEVHLHHDDDTSEQLRETLESFCESLYEKHSLLRKDANGKISYGFVHGNWALDNSRPDGRWCGVNDEINILIETGCYADFTLPSAPSNTQTRTINSIYYAQGDPEVPKSHDSGVPAQVGRDPPEDSLLIIQGPLMLDWQHRKWFVLPRLENGDLQGRRKATLSRFRLWQQAKIGVIGRPDWRFIKIHTHGCDEANAEIVLGKPMKDFHRALKQYAERHPGFNYYYVTAHEMAMLVHQAEQGATEPNWCFSSQSSSCKSSTI